MQQASSPVATPEGLHTYSAECTPHFTNLLVRQLERQIEKGTNAEFVHLGHSSAHWKVW